MVLFVNKDIFTLPFNSRYLSALACLVALARNSKTILNKSGESRYPCFVLDNGEQAHSVSFKYDVNGRFFIDALYQVAEVPLCS